MFKSFFTFIFIIINFGHSFAQTNEYSIAEETKLYTKVPDINITTKQGQIKLSEIYDKSPLIVAMIFTRCTGICSPLILQLSENIDALDLREKFRVLVISFDPRDNITDMGNFAKQFKLENDKQWIFATTDQITELNDAIDFNPVWDSVWMQFDHDALLVGLNENGYIVKKLLGLRDEKNTLSLIKEINSEFIPSYPLPRKNMLFSCFTYDPATGEKKASIGLLILILPAIITALLLIWFATKKPKPIDSAN